MSEKTNISWKISIASTATQQYYRAWQQKATKLKFLAHHRPHKKEALFNYICSREMKKNWRSP